MYVGLQATVVEVARGVDAGGAAQGKSRRRAGTRAVGARSSDGADVAAAAQARHTQQWAASAWGGQGGQGGVVQDLKKTQT